MVVVVLARSGQGQSGGGAAAGGRRVLVRRDAAETRRETPEDVDLAQLLEGRCQGAEGTVTGCSSSEAQFLNLSAHVEDARRLCSPIDPVGLDDRARRGARDYRLVRRRRFRRGVRRSSLTACSPPRTASAAAAATPPWRPTCTRRLARCSAPPCPRVPRRCVAERAGRRDSRARRASRARPPLAPCRPPSAPPRLARSLAGPFLSLARACPLSLSRTRAHSPSFPRAATRPAHSRARALALAHAPARPAPPPAGHPRGR